MAKSQNKTAEDKVSSSPKRPKSLKLKAITIVSCLIAATLLAFGIWGLYQRFTATSGTGSIPSQTVNYSTDNPEETSVDKACKDHSMPADQPRKIIIDDINVDGCIQAVGTDQNKAIAVPTNVNLAGWYINSAKPGNNGNTIIDGHVSGRYSDGVFKQLDKLNAGDNIQIELGDLSKQNYQVTSVDSYPESQASQEIFKTRQKTSNQLVLITCGGSFDKASQQYSHRVVVRAKIY